jgi:hypothetical protein
MIVHVPIGHTQSLKVLKGHQIEGSQSQKWRYRILQTAKRALLFSCIDLVILRGFFRRSAFVHESISKIFTVNILE